jgi:hypothetical protein
VLDFSEWHIGVIGQILFTMTFGLVASVLSIGGLCAVSLPKKVYYYHSAGEIHIICGEYGLHGACVVAASVVSAVVRQRHSINASFDLMATHRSITAVASTLLAGQVCSAQAVLSTAAAYR